MSKKKFLLAAALAGYSMTAFAAEEAKDASAANTAPAAEAAKKPMKKVHKAAGKAKKAAPVKEVVHHHKHVDHNKGLTVTLGGQIDAQVGYRGQKSTYDTNFPGAVRDPNGNVGGVRPNKTQKTAIVNDTKVDIKADGQAHGMKYGGKVVFNADVSQSKYGYGLLKNDNIATETKVWASSQFGKVELGSTKGAYAALRASAANIARATGGIDGDAQYWVNPYIYNDGQSLLWTPEHFHVNPNLPSNYVNGLNASAAKVSYYTPAYMGFKLGVSYTPDSEQMGTVAKTQSVFKNVSANPTLAGWKNVWEGGLSYKNKFDQVGVHVAVTGNAGDAKDFKIDDKTSLKRKNLRAWEVGAVVDYMGFKLGGSYADLGRSGSVKTYNATATNALTGKKKASYWNAGVAYEYEGLGASVTYLESQHGAAPVRNAASTNLGNISTTVGGGSNVVLLNSSNKYNALSFGVDYKLAPGFMPYAEVTSFTLKQGNPSAVDANGDATDFSRTRHKNSGVVVLAGTKLHF